MTHPHHPLCGQQLEIVRIRRGSDPDLIVRLQDGLHAALPQSWTDYLASSDLLPITPPPLLHLDGLRQAAQLVQRLAHRSRSSQAVGRKSAPPPHRPGEPLSPE